MEKVMKKSELLEKFRSKVSEFKKLRIKKEIEAHRKQIELNKNKENIFSLKK